MRRPYINRFLHNWSVTWGAWELRVWRSERRPRVDLLRWTRIGSSKRARAFIGSFGVPPGRYTTKVTDVKVCKDGSVAVTYGEFKEQP